LPVQAVDQRFVRERFCATYAETEEDSAKRQTKLRVAFHRALGEAQARELVGILRAANGRTMVWLVA
jgi:hypothetical protein